MPSGTRAPLAFIEPMAATFVAELPSGPEWSYEIKLDGYRVLALKSGDDVRLLSRRSKDLTRDFPSVVAAVRRVSATTVTLDGEIVAVD
jgi:ATP-dependent DNA ligase